MHNLTYMWNPKENTKLIDTENRLVIVRGGGVRWGRGRQRHQLPVIK